jgi:carbonic anhydrase
MKTYAIVLAGIFLAASVFGQTTKEQQSKLAPEAVLKDLLEGNARFVQGKTSDPDIARRITNSASGQYPKAVVLSCLDSRVPVELVFDQGIGDVFVGRVAGNIEDEDQLGSMEFATKVAGAKLVMVLGHSDCGAVKGACDNAKLGNLTALLKKITPAVESVKDFKQGERTSANKKFVEAVIAANVLRTVADIRKRSEVLADLEAKKQIMIVGALYDLQSGKVTILGK